MTAQATTAQKVCRIITWYIAFALVYIGCGYFMLHSRWGGQYVKDDKARRTAIMWYLIGGLLIAPVALTGLGTISVFVLRRAHRVPAANTQQPRTDLELGLRDFRPGCHSLRMSRRRQSGFHSLGLTRSNQTIDSVFPTMNSQPGPMAYNISDNIAEPPPAYRATARSWSRSRHQNTTEI